MSRVRCENRKIHAGEATLRTFDVFDLNWARLELNQHALAGTRPSTLRVCQFRHEPSFTKFTRQGGPSRKANL